MTQLAAQHFMTLALLAICVALIWGIYDFHRHRHHHSHWKRSWNLSGNLNRRPAPKRVMLTERVECVDGGVASEISYWDEDGNVVGWWAYGAFDPALPYQGQPLYHPIPRTKPCT